RTASCRAPRPPVLVFFAIGITACVLNAAALGMTLSDAAAKGEALTLATSLRQLAVRETTRGAALALGVAAASPLAAAVSCGAVAAAAFAGPLLARIDPPDVLAIAFSSLAV